MRAWPAAVVLVAALMLSGCSGEKADPLPAEWQGRDLRQGTWLNASIEPGWSLALEYPPWTAGTKIAWDWFTTPDQYLYFQLVRTENGQPVKLFARHATQEAGSATIPQSGTHQFVWVNDFLRPIQVTVQPPEGSQQRFYPPGEGPGCLLLEFTAC